MVHLHNPYPPCLLGKTSSLRLRTCSADNLDAVAHSVLPQLQRTLRQVRWPPPAPYGCPRLRLSDSPRATATATSASHKRGLCFCTSLLLLLLLLARVLWAVLPNGQHYSSQIPADHCHQRALHLGLNII